MFRKRIGVICAIAAFGLGLAGCPQPEEVQDGGDGQQSTLDSGGATPGDGQGDEVAAGGGATSGARPADGAGSSTGEQPPKDETGNPAPLVTADAGEDRTVEDGQAVALTGRGTSSDGNPVTYAWTQLSGTPVGLANATTASPTFTAPETSGELRFVVAVQSPAGSATDVVTVTVRAAPILFVVNQGDASVVSFRKPAALNGDAASRTAVAGADTRFDFPSDAVIDRGGSLLVVNSGANRIVGFLDGVKATGNISPVRLVAGSETKLNSPTAMAYDSAADLLFVANFDAYPNTINVYADASSPNFSGPVAPARQIRSFLTPNIRGLRLTPDGDLYTANAGNQSVAVFEGAATLNGDVMPSRQVISPPMASVNDVWIDAQDRMFVVDPNARQILVFTGASTLNGEVTPAGAIRFDALTRPVGLAIDSNGVGYVSDDALNAVYVLENIAALDGPVTPSRVLQGPATKLSAPWRLMLVER